MSSTSSSSIMTTAMATFAGMTLAYSIIKYFIRNSSTKTIRLSLVIYGLLTIIVQFVLLGFLTKSTSGSFDWGAAALHGLIPWVVLFGSIIMLLFFFPGWKAPFSNTFGYLITLVLGVKSIFHSILKPNNEIKNDPKLSKAMEEIYSDESMMINTFTPDNFDRKINEYKGIMRNELKNASPSDIAFSGLKKMVYIKDITSEFLWLLLSGLLIVSMSSMQVISSDIIPSSDAIDAKQKKYAENLAKQAHEKELKKSKETVYKISD